MANFLEKILFGKQYIGIELFSVNNEDKIAFLQVERKKDELVISKNEIFDKVDSSSVEKSKSPAILLINNIQVLQKETAGIDPNDRKLLHKAFPNLQIDDFYYEIWRRETSSIITICRKNYVDDTIISFNNMFTITAVSLGLSSISNLASFSLPNVVTTNTQTLFLNNEDNFTLSGVTENINYVINGLQVSNTYLLSFSGILKLLLPGVTTGSITDLNLVLIENFKQQSFFGKGIKAGLILILSLLVINFLLFTHYFDKAREMNEKVSLNQSGIENIKKIKQRIKEKEQTFKNFTNSSASRSSLLINEFIKILPSSILLSEIAYHPLEKKIKEGEAILSEDGTIIIVGSTLSNEAFSSWIEKAEKMNRVKDVMITSFGKDVDNNTVFSIKISIK